jgi:hypothetical protein
LHRFEVLTVESESPGSGKSRRSRRTQFGLLAIFVLTTVCAAIAGLVRLIDVPPLGRYLLGGYLIFLAIPLVLRLPSVVRNLLGASADLARIKAERNQLRDWAERRRQDHRRSPRDSAEATGERTTNWHD